MVAINPPAVGLLFACAMSEFKDLEAEIRVQRSVRRVLSALAASGKLCAVVLALALTGVLHGAPANTVPDRLLVKPRDGSNESELQQVFATHGAQQHANIHQIYVRILNVP